MSLYTFSFIWGADVSSMNDWTLCGCCWNSRVVLSIPLDKGVDVMLVAPCFEAFSKMRFYSLSQEHVDAGAEVFDHEVHSEILASISIPLLSPSSRKITVVVGSSSLLHCSFYRINTHHHWETICGCCCSAWRFKRNLDDNAGQTTFLSSARYSPKNDRQGLFPYDTRKFQAHSQI